MPDPTMPPLPSSVKPPNWLGRTVVAEHPDGHRLVGQVRGCGTQGVILHAPALPTGSSGFLAYSAGWTVLPSSGSDDPAHTDGEQQPKPYLCACPSDDPRPCPLHDRDPAAPAHTHGAS